MDHGLGRVAVGDDQVVAADDARLAGLGRRADHVHAQLMDRQRQGAPICPVEMGGVFQGDLWHEGVLVSRPSLARA
ncbi:hypothetical protein D3C81_1938190 [compost metagenome]